ncbi:MAG TPA: GNAT family N-acetyltransferase [Pseudolabrys sp.]|jgi:phosphinothricin acetyltransferase|nr:GNAT family N-acetyltransferase [Pseudolabrys sp.]
MSIEIRPARSTDIPVITRIYSQAVEHGTASFELAAPDEGEMWRRMQHLLADNFPYLAAEIAGTVRGYAYAAPYRARPAYRWTVEDSVYVASDMYRRGVGRALLKALIEVAEAGGFRQMIAVIGDSTKQASSIGLHMALGFRHAGILQDVGFKHGRWLDSVLMQRALGDGAATSP